MTDLKQSLSSTNFFVIKFCSKKWQNKKQKKSHNNIEKNIGSIKPFFQFKN